MSAINVFRRLSVGPSLLLVLLLMQSANGSAQTTKDIFAMSTIPKQSRKVLHERLNLFVEYQRIKHWDKAAALLGEFKANLDGKERRYNQQERKELPEKLSGTGMTSFEPIILSFSTRIYSQPLEQRAWTLAGCAEYKSDQGTVRGKGVLIIYRNKGQWFFSQLIPTMQGHQPRSCEDKGPF